MKWSLNQVWPILWLIFSAALIGFLIIGQFIFPSSWREIKNTTEVKQFFVLPDEQEKMIWPPEQSSEKRTVNFLLLGTAGEGYEAPDLTDTILVARFQPARQTVYLFSLPRDLLVKIPDKSGYTKINALYALTKSDPEHKFDSIRKIAQEITGLPIDHYVFVDLTTVKNLVDVLGGVNVLVPQDILDTQFPGPNRSFQTFEIKAGWRYLDGETALKYLRTRHSPAGDFARIERQQEILQALKQKILSLDLWQIGTFFDILNTVTSRLKTDLTLWQIKDYWLAVKDIPGGNLIKIEINNTNLLTGGQAVLGDEVASVLYPKAGPDNYEEIKKFISEQINFK